MTCRGDNGDCPRAVRARGLCRQHYDRVRAGLDIDQPIAAPGRPVQHVTCTEAGCDRPHFALRYCRRCYDRRRRESKIAAAAEADTAESGAPALRRRLCG